ncbi:hypothetical protein N1851_026080 [Merluccius polli]|uniref:Uncharacterized protein n=1 Tax=Merluccius polli TaxID=89951 RepID=A0AA47MCH0_MERPO|nr:hypothetical protein N1851_026080 [Merluccius polli]
MTVRGGGLLSIHEALGHLDDEHHGVSGLVAEGSADDVHSVLVGDPLQGDPVHRHQLKPSLEGRADLEKVIHTFICSRLDYCNSGISQSTLSRLQLVQNAAARLLTDPEENTCDSKGLLWGAVPLGSVNTVSPPRAAAPFPLECPFFRADLPRSGTVASPPRCDVAERSDASSSK